MSKYANSDIALQNITILDDFWNKYVKLVKEVIIPYQLDILNDRIEGIETSHCISNFKIAAGEAKGEFQGAVFKIPMLQNGLKQLVLPLALAEMKSWKN